MAQNVHQEMKHRHAMKHYDSRVRIAYYDILVRDVEGYSARHKNRKLFAGRTDWNVETEQRRLKMIKRMKRPQLP